MERKKMKKLAIDKMVEKMDNEKAIKFLEKVAMPYYFQKQANLKHGYRNNKPNKSMAEQEYYKYEIANEVAFDLKNC